MAVKNPPSSKRNAKPEPPKKRSLRRTLIRYGLFGMLGFVVLMTLMYLFAKIPAPNEVATAQSTVVEDYRGRPIGRLHGSEDRVIIPLSQMAPILRKAVIAAEDRDFYRHKGVSIAGIARATIANALSGRVKQGGSTITQQYVKNAFVGRERTLWRKVREAMVSVKLERNWKKDEILEAYLNTIYFGRGAYGIHAASRAYFGVTASKLTLEQSALLAGIIRAPEALDPSRKPDAAKRARDRVLRAMASEKMISDDERAAASDADLGALPRKLGVSGRAPHFLEVLRRDLIGRFGEDAVYREGMKVRTTLDVNMQKAAEEAVAEILDRPDDPQAALVSIDPATGSVRAFVGGRDFKRSEFDMVTQARRQPGSSFKPFVLAARIEQGANLSDTYRSPASITLKVGGQTWKVGNYDRKDYGMLSLSGATESSVNTAYAQMIVDAGPQTVAELAERLGITSELEPVAALALGVEEVTPLELTSAYATLAADGMHVRPHLIVSIHDRHGKERYRFSERATRALPQRTARVVTQALQGVIERGTGRRAAFGRPAAGKTGTTENHRDAWFAGYTPDLATAVWMGFPDGSRTMGNVRGIAVTGGSYPARIWKAFMTQAHDGVSVREFPRPEDAPSPAPSPQPSGSSSPGVVPSIPAPTQTFEPVPIPEPSGGSSQTPEPSQSSQPTPTQSASPSPSQPASPKPTATASSSPQPQPSGGSERPPG